jgi:hypothetical protein
VLTQLMLTDCWQLYIRHFFARSGTSTCISGINCSRRTQIAPRAITF